MFLMDSHNEQSLAWARFQSFRSHPPSSGSQDEVAQFHDVVSALEKAFALDLSSFRIPDAEMRQQIVSFRRAPRSGRFPAQTRLSDKRSCDVQLLLRQMDGIALYFQNLQPPPEDRKIGF